MGLNNALVNSIPYKWADINGVTFGTGLVEFVNNVDGGNLLTIHGGSISGAPQIVYTSVDPSYSITNSDIVYEDAGLSSPFDGDDTFYWVDPTCSISAIAYADIDNDGVLSSRFCVSP
tara:strand:- start:20 stop:373 length:354 start_codon:yes stop_codon:yes gene_type:complete